MISFNSVLLNEYQTFSHEYSITHGNSLSLTIIRHIFLTNIYPLRHLSFPESFFYFPVRSLPSRWSFTIDSIIFYYRNFSISIPSFTSAKDFSYHLLFCSRSRYLPFRNQIIFQNMNITPSTYFTLQRTSWPVLPLQKKSLREYILYQVYYEFRLFPLDSIYLLALFSPWEISFRVFSIPRVLPANISSLQSLSPVEYYSCILLFPCRNFLCSTHFPI